MPLTGLRCFKNAKSSISKVHVQPWMAYPRVNLLHIWFVRVGRRIYRPVHKCMEFNIHIGLVLRGLHPDSNRQDPEMEVPWYVLMSQVETSKNKELRQKIQPN